MHEDKARVGVIPNKQTWVGSRRMETCPDKEFPNFQIPVSRTLLEPIERFLQLQTNRFRLKAFITLRKPNEQTLVKVSMKKGGFYVHLMKIKVVIGAVPQKKTQSGEPSSWCKSFVKVKVFNLKEPTDTKMGLPFNNITEGISFLPKHPSGVKKSKTFAKLNLFQNPMMLKTREFVLNSNQPCIGVRRGHGFFKVDRGFVDYRP
ncbi:hypothetical protein O181_075699 [Austropuccinia psidii MF-1]|uniref:Uncharacterized protein n=1 Tax=Austropuccinia psidii MF-1 TaxID=1389203 RepID=A0A9Q3FBH3_9BASI|nr:hypothetical protein [Austropuccinia psidii MF-1]